MLSHAILPVSPPTANNAGILGLSLSMLICMHLLTQPAPSASVSLFLHLTAPVLGWPGQLLHLSLFSCSGNAAKTGHATGIGKGREAEGDNPVKCSPQPF